MSSSGTRNAGTRSARVVKVMAVGAGAVVLVGGLTGLTAANATNNTPVIVGNTPDSPVPVTGTVRVGNLPATQAVSGTVQVGNLPATQAVSGTVQVGNLPATQRVSGTVSLDPTGSAVTSGDVSRVLASGTGRGQGTGFTSTVIESTDVSSARTVRLLLACFGSNGYVGNCADVTITVVASGYIVDEFPLDSTARATRVYDVPGTTLEVWERNADDRTNVFASVVGRGN